MERTCVSTRPHEAAISGRQRIVLLLVLIFLLPLAGILINFHLRFFRLWINTVGRIFLLGRLLVFVALLLIGWLFHEPLDGDLSWDVAPSHRHNHLSSPQLSPPWGVYRYITL
jgi:hypothetical protein